MKSFIVLIHAVSLTLVSISPVFASAKEISQKTTQFSSSTTSKLVSDAGAVQRRLERQRRMEERRNRWMNRPNRVEQMFKERRIEAEKRRQAKERRRQYYNSLSPEQKRQHDLEQQAIQRQQLRRSMWILKTGAELDKVFGSGNGSSDRNCTRVRRLPNGALYDMPVKCQ